MAYDPRNVKYPSEVPPNHPASYPYSAHHTQTDENRNENDCGNKEIRRSSGTQTIQKVDAATMTDPLQIDFRLTSEYLARCSNTLGLPYVSKYEENSEASSQNCRETGPKSEYDVVPRHINGVPIYDCPECAYRFEDREALREHLEDHRQRPHICDICGASLKRKEHLDRHKQGHNKDRPYQCSMCCKAFKRNEHLARHSIIHSGSKNQICPECGKAFYRKDHLKKHLQSHSGGARKSLESSRSTRNGQDSGEEPLSGYSMMTRPSGAPPFSIIRT